MEDRGWLLTVKFLESKLLRFADETKDHTPGYQVEASVETNYALLARETAWYIREETYRLQWVS